MMSILEEYIKEIYRTYSSGNTTEGSFYPHIKKLFESIFSLLGYRSFSVIILPSRTSACYPDGKVIDGIDVIGHFECKDIGDNLEKISNTDQIKKYISYFENFILTNFLEFWFYRNGSPIKKVKLLSYEDFERENFYFRPSSISDFEQMLREFLTFRIPNITTAEDLARYLARKTTLMRYKLKLLLNSDERLKEIYKIFKNKFIIGMDEDSFCDTLAQAFSYSLLIAKLYSPPFQPLTPERALTLIPENLRLIRDFFVLLYTDITDDEIKQLISDLAEILSKFNPVSLFAKGLTLDDIVTYFYEPFLKIYNPDQREIRGVYLTPSPVVRFIVKSVDRILKETFKIEDGLGAQNDSVKVLDPAGGTLTFIIHALHLAIETIKTKYGKGLVREWLDRYGTQNYFAFELLPSAYVIGHLRMSAMFKTYNLNKKFNLYLTNTLELEHTLPLFTFGLLRDMSEETKEADKIKKEVPIMVIMGNPPYSVISANMEAQVSKKLKEDWDGCQSYYKVDNRPLGERKVCLQDDYVKFIRFGQWKINSSGKGILAYITNHAYLDNPTFRGMRQSLLKTFDRIYILNLHGNARKKEPDENVFDIQQGVAIGIFVKDGSKDGEHAEVYYASTLDMRLFTREEKYNYLKNNTVASVKFQKIQPESPFYFFVPKDKIKKFPSIGEFKVNEIFEVKVTGIMTARDQLVIGFTEDELKRKIETFKNPKFSDEDIREMFFPKKSRSLKFPPGDTREWKLSDAREKIRKDSSWDHPSRYRKILYRPFDIRWIYYVGYMIHRERWNVMKHFLNCDNIGLITVRQVAEGEFNHAYVTSIITESRITLSNRGAGYVFPLYLCQEDSIYNSSTRKVNFTDHFLNFLRKNYPSLTEKDVFYYIYAILYSECYRSVYKPELMYDFPLIPFFKEETIKALVPLGERLVELHTEWETRATPLGRYPESGDDIVKEIRYEKEKNKLKINDSQYFEGIPEEVWNYHIGGYQVLSKWLKERTGRKISPSEFMKIAGAIKETIEIQNEIDRFVDFLC